jgi:hypothetical protein
MRVAMPLVSPELKADYEHRLELARVPPAQRPGYHKWVRWYLYFCQKYGYAPNLPTSRGPFLNKLASTNPPMDQLIAAAAAIRLLPRPAGSSLGQLAGLPRPTRCQQPRRLPRLP